MTDSSIAQNVSLIRERIANAAAKASRDISEITLIGVSKTQPAEALREAYAAGIRHFGENRVQEWEGKQPGLSGVKGYWHLIGHLQSNKSAKAAKLFHSVDSVDDIALAERLNRTREDMEAAEPLRVLIEVSVALEETKSGVDPRDLSPLAEKILELPKLSLQGLMCIPPFFEDAEQARPYFVKLRGLRDDLQALTAKKLPVLSMGMSHDFEVAIEEGATEIRVGTALFGARNKI